MSMHDGFAITGAAITIAVAVVGLVFTVFAVVDWGVKPRRRVADQDRRIVDRRKAVRRTR